MELEKYGRWTILSKKAVNGVTIANCKCDCGKIKDVRFYSITCGDSTSCGCYAAEKASERATTHGLSKHKLFQTWYDAYRRCCLTSRKDYHHYGGRGIEFADEWMPPAEAGFVKFLEDMESGFEEGLELDRIDNDGNYCKENCKWSTRSEQVRNRRHFDRNHSFIDHEGKQVCVIKIAEENNLSAKVLWDRLFKLKWDYEKAISEPMRFKRYLCETENGLINLVDFCKQYNINVVFYNNTKRTKGVNYAVETILSPHGATALYGESKGELSLIYKTKEKQND